MPERVLDLHTGSCLQSIETGSGPLSSRHLFRRLRDEQFVTNRLDFRREENYAYNMMTTKFS